jgi:thiosulfate dehydrogenase (quinone) large subunit
MPKTLEISFLRQFLQSYTFAMTNTYKAIRGNLTTKPPRASHLSEWALLPLRAFLGVTFMFAGLQKLSNPNFFNPKSPISIQAQLAGATHTSPIHALLAHMLSIASPIGHVIAFGEIAVGLGIFFGLLTRVAAIGGALISFSLFLAVSFHASPYFTGADIVFVFAFLPFIVAGSPSKLSIDGIIREYAASKESLPSVEMVTMNFGEVQRLCGHYNGGNCAARSGLSCASSLCPVLLGKDAPSATPVQIASVERRTLMLASTAAGTAALGALIVGSTVGATGKLIGGAPAPTTNVLSPGTTTTNVTTTTTAPVTTTTAATTTTEAAAKTVETTTTTEAATTTTAAKVAGTLLGAASEVPVGKAASISLPSGDPGIVVHVSASEWRCYDAVCPHAGCTVGYSGSMLVCPCHGSEFQVSNGDVISGPAPHGLEEFKIVESANGNLYLQ